jgi:hypothetical protein
MSGGGKLGCCGGCAAAGDGCPSAAKSFSEATIVPPSGFTPGDGDGAGAGIAGAGAAGSGMRAEPGMGGATPTIVPFNLLGGPPGRGGSAALVGGVGAGAPGGAGGAAGAPGTPCWFIISMVPLNFGAAAPFKLKLHFEHVRAVSGFCVPQFGQNT